MHREINELNPIVDARLSDGSVVNAVYKNIALNGPILTIRKFPDTVMTMDDLISNGTVEEETASFLEEAGGRIQLFHLRRDFLGQDNSPQCPVTEHPSR
ncbi:MAG: hypothetical protein V8Q42_08745 [Anaerovoracaceae bacterium]